MEEEEEGNAESSSALLEAFRCNSGEDEMMMMDVGTIRFLLDTLEHATEEERHPILEPFVSDPSPILQVLRQGHSNAVARAKAVLMNETAVGGGQEDGGPMTTEEEHHVFQNCTYTPIPGAHNRAISLEQLRQILEYIRSQVVDPSTGELPWVDDNPHSPTYGVQLTVATMNLYHVVDFIIKPLTAPYQCSMVEIMATKPQIPQFFVSHAWREPVCEMVAALTEHAKVRGLDMDHTLYWICGYGNDQHNLSADIPDDPKETSFYKALKQCQGMLLCLDSLGTPFERVWCCYEQVLATSSSENDNHNNNNKLLLDIATVVDGTTAVVITDGRAAPVAADLREGPNFCLEFKRDRERGFPLDLLERGYEIDICAAQAAREEDRRRILNTIRTSMSMTTTMMNDTTTITTTASRDQEPPNLTDPAFARVNKVLRGIFAEAAARKAAEAGRIDIVISVLQQDTERTKLTLNLGGCAHLDLAGLSNLAGHPSLRQLTLDCSYSGVHNMTTLTDTLAALPRLQRLQLHFEWCTTLEENDIVQLSGRGLFALRETLQELKLAFTGCSFAVFLPQIEKLQKLERLSINYSFTPTAAIAKTLLGILQLRNLRELSLAFNACQNVTRLRPLKKLVQLVHLETLSLDFNYTNLGEVDGLASLLELRNLRYCNLKFTKCTQITSIPWINKVVYQDGLELIMDLSECKGLAPHLQHCFPSRHALLQALSGGTSTSSSSNAMVAIGEEVEYFSRTKRVWYPAVVHSVDLEEIDVRVRGEQSKFPRKVLVAEIPFRIRRKNQVVLSVTEQFSVGDSVQYFARDWKRVWLPAVVKKVEANALQVDVEGYDHPRRVDAADIPLQIRKGSHNKEKSRQLRNQQAPPMRDSFSNNSEATDTDMDGGNVTRDLSEPTPSNPPEFRAGDPIEYFSPQEPEKGWQPAIVHKKDARGIRVRTPGNQTLQRVFNRDIGNLVRQMQTRKGQRDPVQDTDSLPMDDSRGAKKRDMIAEASYGHKSRLLGNFRVGESVEFFSKYHQRQWMPAIVNKIDDDSLRLNVAGYRDTRRVLASDIPTKIRKTEKPKKQK